MYFTRLPNHNEPGFDEQMHFSQFKKHNIVFNAWSSDAFCEDHVGCLSLKTILSGEEQYTIDRRRIAIRPGQFLILNDEQRYSCRIRKDEPARVLSIFFKKEFASAVYRYSLGDEGRSMEDPFRTGEEKLEFFQTLHAVDPKLLHGLSNLIAHLNNRGGDTGLTDEHLIFLLWQLVRTYKSETRNSSKVNAVKASTKKEIFKRLCFAKDLLHSSYKEKLDLDAISKVACLSVPQLVRQFKFAFHITPHRYLACVRLSHAAGLLQNTDFPVKEIGWLCGFENSSAFGRAFMGEYGIQPERYRRAPFVLPPCHS